ncbi:MAG: DUF4332 domain-containing protein [Spirochaetaceae bacterium]|nr:DUF4332 domain-containing protein [Spirochaetaceae bacterium]
MMSYYIDLKSISLEDLENILFSADLIKSRMILKGNIHDNFQKLITLGIRDTEDLFNILKNKTKLLKLSGESGISVEYLTILIRELKGSRQPPNKIRDFPGLQENLCNALEKQGIKNTQQLYDKVLSPSARSELAELTSLDETTILYLTRLSDLSRIRWVNHTFAYMLLEAGYESAREVAEADIVVMHEKVNRINKEKGFYRGQIGLHDMKLTVDASQFFEQDIVY